MASTDTKQAVEGLVSEQQYLKAKSFIDSDIGTNAHRKIVADYEAQQLGQGAVLGAVGPTDTAAQLFAVEPDKYTVPQELRPLVELDYDINEWKLMEDFGGMDANPLFSTGQYDELKDILDALPPHLESYRPMLQRKLELAKSDQQISFLNPSSSQYLIDRARKRSQGLGGINPWMNMPGVQVAGTDLTGMGIPNALQQQQQQAELMQAGNQALNQTPAQVQAQVAAAQATQQGNYQAPTMTQQQMVQEAQQTGGTVNPHEATQAVSAPRPRPSRPRYGPHGKAHGGVVSLMDLLNRRV